MRFSLGFAHVLLTAFTLMAGAIQSEAWAAQRPLPDLPTYAVYDETQSFQPPLFQALERVIAEHAHLTGEPIFVGIFKDTGEESLDDFTRRLFAQWRSQFQDRNNIVLLTIVVQDRSAKIFSGFAMETQLPETRTDPIINDFVKPELNAGNVARATVLGTVEILRALESPLIQSGEALKLFRAGDFQGDWQPVQLEAQRGFGIFLILGALFILALAYQVLAAEALYSSRGWVRIPPWKIRIRRKRKLGTGLMTGGGASGRW